MKETICRKCFTRISLEEAAYGCQNENCGQQGVPVLADAAEGPPLCRECGENLSIYPRLCTQCAFPVPDEEEAARHLGISIVGAEGCGKSHYLSVTIDQIKQSMAKPYDCALYPLGGDRTMDHYDQHYYNPLFVRGECIPSTPQEEVDPLVYSLIFSGKKGRGSKNCSLTFYDACGANFQKERTMAMYNRSLCNARGILFLIDPSQLPGLREEYKVHKQPVCDEDIYALLSRTIHLIRKEKKSRRLSGKLDIPLAVCLTKTDTLQQRLDPSSYLRYPSRHVQEAMFDLCDFESCNLEVRSLVENWAGRELINQINSQFSKVGFFGFSALGTTPHEQSRISRVAPHRVLDPLLWILWNNKMIGAGQVR